MDESKLIRAYNEGIESVLVSVNEMHSGFTTQNFALKQHISEFVEQNSTLKQEVLGLKEEILDLKKENYVLTSRIAELETSLKKDSNSSKLP